ncbi:hypothetical protein ACFOGI_05880 [Virgibacillus xinjiangensis]|uniref:Zinc ribbon domain-containing protein n=1 Tax=Virgibacillus xinjiangensis TaxID=393090 RepID=A0ABV7CTR9_9BACI
MISCPSCQHQQETGRFCGACGANMEQGPQQQDAPVSPSQTVQSAAVTGSAAEVQPSAASSQVKYAPSGYGYYFLDVLKNPTTAFRSGESHLAYGLINIALFLVTFSLAVYFLISSLVQSMSGFVGIFESDMAAMEVPFFGVMFRVAWVGLIFAAISFVSSVVIAKLARSQATFKEFTAQFGGLFVPFAVVGVVAILSGLAGSITVTLTLLLLALTFITFIVPVVMVAEKGRGTTDQGVYLSLGSSLIAMILSYIVVRNYILGAMEGLSQWGEMFMGGML